MKIKSQPFTLKDTPFALGSIVTNHGVNNDNSQREYRIIKKNNSYFLQPYNFNDTQLTRLSNYCLTSLSLVA